MLCYQQVYCIFTADTATVVYLIHSVTLFSCVSHNWWLLGMHRYCICTGKVEYEYLLFSTHRYQVRNKAITQSPPAQMLCYLNNIQHKFIRIVM